jgi:hypothetical protein
MSLIFPEDLQPLVEQVQANNYSHPQKAIEATRQLLMHCRDAEHIAYAYEQLGFAHLLLGEHRLACLFYEQARTLNPNNIYVLANLAHAQYELGEPEKAVRIGKKALRLKDQEACQAAPTPREALQTPYRGPVNLVAFSLYGGNPRYCEMAVLNVLAAQRHLPDFVCRFYVDHTVPTAVIHRLTHLGAQCVHMSDHETRLPATFWRFLAMDDPQANEVLVRDVDSLIDAKEAWCVQEWRTSQQNFHIIRDDCCHTELILAGLFGIRAGSVRHITSRIEDFMQAAGPAAWQRYADQLFLRHHIWPLVRAKALTHDSVYNYGERVHAIKYNPSPEHGPHNTFIGANHATCQIECELNPAPPAGMQAIVTIKDEADELVCCYPLQAVAETHKWRSHLPRVYLNALESGQWRYDIQVQPEDASAIGQGSVSPSLLNH